MAGRNPGGEIDVDTLPLFCFEVYTQYCIATCCTVMSSMVTLLKLTAVLLLISINVKVICSRGVISLRFVGEQIINLEGTRVKQNKK